MTKPFFLILDLSCLPLPLAGCVALAVGAAGAVVVDEVIEDRDGGEGLF